MTRKLLCVALVVTGCSSGTSAPQDGGGAEDATAEATGEAASDVALADAAPVEASADVAEDVAADAAEAADASDGGADAGDADAGADADADVVVCTGGCTSSDAGCSCQVTCGPHTYTLDCFDCTVAGLNRCNCDTDNVPISKPNYCGGCSFDAAASPFDQYKQLCF
jgi:hypothetical protein